MKYIVLLSVLSVFNVSVWADRIDDIVARGELLVAVKTDYKPYGYLNAESNIVGIEPELAADVADKLGVKLVLVSVVSSNRMEFVSSGKVDLMIATMTDKPDRRKVVLASDPNYYSSGTNVIARKDLDLNQWQDLFGKTVCGVDGAFYNQSTQETYGAEILTFKTTQGALAALKLGKCSAFVFDDSYIAGLLTDTELASVYEMPFETIDDAPWALAVGKGEDRFHTVMNEMIVDWHKTGRILGLEAKYGIKNTSFAVRMHQKYNEILKVH